MMKKLLLALTLFCTPAWADSTIDALGSAAALAGTESVPIFQTANPAVKTTATAIGNTANALNASVITAGTLPVARGGTGITSFGTGVATALGVNASAAGGFSITVASGTSALATGAITSATCASAVTTAATNTATTDVIWWGFNGDPTAVTGYVPLTSGMLTIIAYPSANNVNFKVCNNTTGSITPGAITLNWRVIR